MLLFKFYQVIICSPFVINFSSVVEPASLTARTTSIQRNPSLEAGSQSASQEISPAYCGIRRSITYSQESEPDRSVRINKSRHHTIKSNLTAF